MKLLLDFGFLEMNLHRISLRVFSFNSRAIKLYEKLGFQQKGKLRESIFRGEKWHDYFDYFDIDYSTSPRVSYV